MRRGGCAPRGWVTRMRSRRRTASSASRRGSLDAGYGRRAFLAVCGDPAAKLCALLLLTAGCGTGSSSQSNVRSAGSTAFGQQYADLNDSLRVAREDRERQSLEKDLLVREVHSFDFFVTQIQDEFRKIHDLERQAGTLDPKQDPLASMESGRSHILAEARAVRTRLQLLESEANQDGQLLQSLRDSMHTASDSVVAAGSARDASRIALSGVRLLARDLRNRIDELQHQVDSLARYARVLHEENQRLTAVIAVAAARDSVVYFVVGTRRELLEWQLVRETGGMRLTGWGKGLQAVATSDTSHFTSARLNDLVLPLDEDKTYQIISPQNLRALETPVTGDGIFKGSLHIADPETFWKQSRWLVILVR